MFKLHSVAGRLVIGAAIGFVLGLIIMIISPLFDMPVLSMFGLGTLLMFVLMGVFIGFMGIFDEHPVFDFRVYWWVRGFIAGILFMLMYILLSYDALSQIMQSPLLSWMGLTSPFWALIDGIVIGEVMSFVETKCAGEGKNLPLK